MKRILLLALLICFCLRRCSALNDIDAKLDNTVTTEKPEISEIYDSNIYEYVDKETGVHYLIYSYKGGYAGMGGITPRLNADGSVMVGEIEK